MRPERLIQIVLIAFCTASVYFIFTCFPAENEFKIGADEGTYYRQAKTVLENGTDGFRLLANRYLSNEIEQESPHPLRTGHILSSVLAISIHDSISALAFKSLLYFAFLLLLSWFYLKRLWDTETASFGVFLISISPLIAAMSKRALLDTESLFFTAFSLFAFLDYIRLKTDKSLTVFIAATSISCFLKEAAILILPSYLAVLVFLKFQKKESNTSYVKILASVIIPVVVAGLIHLAMFQNLELLIELVDTIVHSTSSYMEKWGAGPWQQYLMDFILLAPLASLLGILFIGILLKQQPIKAQNVLLIALAAYILILYSFIPKNVRFLMLFEFILRILAALSLVEISRLLLKKSVLKRLITVLILVVLTYEGYTSFNLHFVKHNIYDPIGYNLLYASNVIPNGSYEERMKVEKEEQDPKIKATVDSLIQASVSYYNQGYFMKCIETCSQVLVLDPKSSLAYNNICSAYNQLGQFENATKACEQSLRLNPNYELAKGNLKFAKSKLNQ